MTGGVQGPVIVNPGTNVKFLAGEVVLLKEGFAATKGSNFFSGMTGACY